MTADTRVMRFRGCTYKRIIMAASTARCTNRDARMARIICMGRLPGAGMTGGTIGRIRIAYSGADKNSRTGIMTTCTRIMRFRGCAYKRIIMAVSTTCCTYRNAGMAISGCRVDCAPGANMAGGTVSRARVANGGADQRAAAGIMTAGTCVMGIRSCAYQGIIMAVSTAACTNRNTGMAGIGRMQ